MLGDPKNEDAPRGAAAGVAMSGTKAELGSGFADKVRGYLAPDGGKPGLMASVLALLIRHWEALWM